MPACVTTPTQSVPSLTSLTPPPPPTHTTESASIDAPTHARLGISGGPARGWGPGAATAAGTRGSAGAAGGRGKLIWLGLGWVGIEASEASRSHPRPLTQTPHQPHEQQRQRRAQSSLAPAAPAAMPPATPPVAAGPLKRMNLFTAVNDALRIALETDPSAGCGVYVVCRYGPGWDGGSIDSMTRADPPLTPTHVNAIDHLWGGRGLWWRVPLHRGAPRAVWRGPRLQHAALRAGDFRFLIW